MTIYELTENQLLQLKQYLLMQKQLNEGTSWGELAGADSLVSDEELENEYGDTDFSEDDFSKEED